MVFTPSISVEQSDDGKTITYRNTSNFGDNDDSYDESDFTTNELVLTDAYGDIILTEDFPTSGPDLNKIVHVITKDQWIDARLNLAGIATYTKLVRNGFYRIYQQAAKPYLQAGCCKPKNCDNFGMSQMFRDAAVDAIPIGQSIEFQENIDSANAYLKTAI